ncbi:hypothetical protein K439DRAFT_1624600 [Ramaria rubella]|nr:hypothetical protein K439DRAFT_1624600 [Ramaria rubella]
MSHELYVIQQKADDDRLYHWKLFLADHGSKSKGVWHDVVWSADKDVGMEHRGPKPFDEAKSRLLVALHLIGAIAAKDAAQFSTVAATTPTPKYTVEDKDKNCQTWIYEVVKGLIKEGILSSDAIAQLDKVPKEED